MVLGLLTGAVGSLALGAAMAHWTDSQFPWQDAALTAFSLVAQVWMAQKRLQCWALWCVIDVLYIGFFAYQDLYGTAGLYALFTVIAIQGWRDWHRDPALRT